ncbi:MAG: response regulator [Proteobacteria bacterium]|nr:response regulator [Pseudomonadota bacterium]
MKLFLRMIPKTLLGQILAGFTIVILSYSLVILTAHSFFEDRFFLTLQQEKGEQHVTFLSRLAATGLYTENSLHMQEPIKAIMDRPEVVAVAIYRQDGSLWEKHIKANVIFEELPPETVLALLEKSRQGQKLQPVFTSSICDFLAPITITHFDEFADAYSSSAEQQVIIGLAEVQLSTEHRQAQIRRGQLLDLAITSLAIILSVIVGLWLSRRLSAPVRALTAGAKQATVGQYPEPIENLATGELADLTQAFNRMIMARKESENNLHRELMLNERLAKLSRELISSTDSIEKIAHFVLIMAQQLTDSSHGFVSSIDQKTGENICHTLTSMIKDQCDIKPDRQKIAFPPNKQGEYNGLWGHVLNSRKSLFTNTTDHQAATGVPPGHVKIDKFLSVPVIFNGELVGQIALANPARDYTDHDVASIERLADLYALAINRQRALQERERLLADLRQAQKMEAIGTLAGGIAHDFNNILSAILGFTEISLMEVKKGSKLHHNLSMVNKAGDRARDLVAQILTFSRHSQIERYPILVAPIIKEALKLLRATLPSSIEIHQNIHSGTGKVLADPVQIHRIMMNLCTNAFHAMDGTGGVLEINLVEEEIDKKKAEQIRDLQPGPYLRLSVSDTGSGIKPEILDRIFDPFFTTKEKGQGTGMGLSMVHGIMKEYNGAIKVQSEVGKGSVLHLYFPLIRGIDDLTDNVETPLLVKGKGRILLVDDEQDLAEMGRNLLELLGYDVVSCTDSIEALKTFKNDPDSFDLVVTDQTMPMMSGMELAREIMKTRPQMPIFLCTGYSSFVSQQDAKQLGIREFFLKPISAEELSQAIHRHLTGR